MMLGPSVRWKALMTAVEGLVASLSLAWVPPSVHVEQVVYSHGEGYQVSS